MAEKQEREKKLEYISEKISSFMKTLNRSDHPSISLKLPDK